MFGDLDSAQTIQLDPNLVMCTARSACGSSLWIFAVPSKKKLITEQLWWMGMVSK
jgi:hypothetical protein